MPSEFVGLSVFRECGILEVQGFTVLSSRGLGPGI